MEIDMRRDNRFGVLPRCSRAATRTLGEWKYRPAALSVFRHRPCKHLPDGRRRESSDGEIGGLCLLIALKARALQIIMAIEHIDKLFQFIAQSSVPNVWRSFLYI